MKQQVGWLLWMCLHVQKSQANQSSSLMVTYAKSLMGHASLPASTWCTVEMTKTNGKNDFHYFLNISKGWKRCSFTSLLSVISFPWHLKEVEVPHTTFSCLFQIRIEREYVFSWPPLSNPKLQKEGFCVLLLSTNTRWQRAFMRELAYRWCNGVSQGKEGNCLRF